MPPASTQATAAASARADRRPARAATQLIRGLEAARGNGTSMISLIMHPRDQVRLRCRARSRAPTTPATGRDGHRCRRGGETALTRAVATGRQVSRVAKMLADEFGTASNIKNRVNRQARAARAARSKPATRSRALAAHLHAPRSRCSALSRRRSNASSCTTRRARKRNAADVSPPRVADRRATPRRPQVPPNGLVLYTGTILTDEGKEKKVNIDFEPFKTINTSLYLCDNKFHTEALSELLESENKYGFIVMDGNGTLFGTLSGNTREILHKFTVDLPKKHGRGGQSALRFARLRMEKRHNYVRKARGASGVACRPRCCRRIVHIAVVLPARWR